MSTKTKTTKTKAKKENLAALGLPALWERFKEATGETTKSPNKKFLVRRIQEALATRAAEPAPAEEPQRPTHTSARATPAPEPETTLAESTPPKPRGRFASMTIEELQMKYIEVVGRSTGSDDRRYLIWKIREAEKGRINVGPRKTRARDGEPLDVKILPLRLEADVADKMDEAWRAKGIKNRMEFFRGAIGHYLAHLGARRRRPRSSPTRAPWALERERDPMGRRRPQLPPTPLRGISPPFQVPKNTPEAAAFGLAGGANGTCLRRARMSAEPCGDIRSRAPSEPTPTCASAIDLFGDRALHGEVVNKDGSLHVLTATAVRTTRHGGRQ